MPGFLLMVAVSVVGAVLIAKWTVKIGELLSRVMGPLYERGLTIPEKIFAVAVSHTLVIVAVSRLNVPRLSGTEMLVGALLILVEMSLLMTTVFFPTREETS